VRVVVADDVMITREGIIHLLRGAGFDVVGQAEDLDGLRATRSHLDGPRSQSTRMRPWPSRREGLGAKGPARPRRIGRLQRRRLPLSHRAPAGAQERGAGS
jgi:hypothetical protein